MSDRAIRPVPLTRDAFAPFGEVMDIATAEQRPINAGTCTRFHALTHIDVVGEGARVVVNLFRAKPFAMPLALRMMERHPLGAQAFWPLSGRDWLAAVAPDENGRPGRPILFEVPAEKGVSYAPNIWHHPLLVLGGACDFLVVDRDGPGVNLEEADYAEPWSAVL